MSEEIISEITKLTDEWRTLIVRDHHKDRDCHWYINTVWSHGNPPYYRIEHYGYVHEDVSEKFDTYDAALIALRDIMVQALEAERKIEANEHE